MSASLRAQRPLPYDPGTAAIQPDRTQPAAEKRGHQARTPDESGDGSPRRRGALRPDVLAPSRARIGGRTRVALFRAVDMFAVSLLAALGWTMAVGGNPLLAPAGFLLPFVFGPLWTMGLLKAADCYSFGNRDGLLAHVAKVAAAILCVFLLLVTLVEVLPQRLALRPALPALTLLPVILCGLHGIWWMLVRRWRKAGVLTPNIVLVGATANAERFISKAKESGSVSILGIFDDRAGRVPPDILGVPVLGDTRDLVEHRLMPFVDRIVVSVPAEAQGRVRELMQRLRVLPNEISLILDEDDPTRQAAFDRLADAPLARLSGVRAGSHPALLKRLQDLVLGTIIFALAVPVMAIIAVAVRLDSPGPIFFRQRRHGFNNEEIVVWKFRSMRHDASDARAHRQVSAGDDRITRVGRFIRRTSLDEIPQIINVLRGEMSLVGPRPHAIGMRSGGQESARLVAEYAHRHRVKPGLTGWAAIKGSRGPVDTPEEVRRRVALDVEYIDRQSFWLDLYIILMTVPCLLGDRSAVR
jgi:Undecaprenyl-phosphate glucose phosphotransferase